MVIELNYTSMEAKVTAKDKVNEIILLHLVNSEEDKLLAILDVNLLNVKHLEVFNSNKLKENLSVAIILFITVDYII